MFEDGCPEDKAVLSLLLPTLFGVSRVLSLSWSSDDAREDLNRAFRPEEEVGG